MIVILISRGFGRDTIASIFGDVIGNLYNGDNVDGRIFLKSIRGRKQRTTVPLNNSRYIERAPKTRKKRNFLLIMFLSN